MIFAICGLTSEGTGTERAGTSSIAGDVAFWAKAAGYKAGYAATIAAHKAAVPMLRDLLNRFAVAFIARPLFRFCLFCSFSFCFSSATAQRRVRQPFCNPVGLTIFLTCATPPSAPSSQMRTGKFAAGR
jgi:hypothetical protein